MFDFTRPKIVRKLVTQTFINRLKVVVKIKWDLYPERCYFDSFCHKMYDLFLYRPEFSNLLDQGVNVSETEAWCDFEILPFDIISENSIYRGMLKDYHNYKIKSYENPIHELMFTYKEIYILKPYSDFLRPWFSHSDILIIFLSVLVVFVIVIYFRGFVSNYYLGILFVWWLIFYFCSFVFDFFAIVGEFYSFILICYYNLMENFEFSYCYLVKLVILFGVSPRLKSRPTIFSFSMGGWVVPLQQYYGLKEYILEKELVRRLKFRSESCLKYLSIGMDYNMKLLNMDKSVMPKLENTVVLSKGMDLDIRELDCKFNRNFSLDFKNINLVAVNICNGDYKNRFYLCIDSIKYVVEKLSKKMSLWSRFVNYLDNLILKKKE